jgi:hypothetical protein
MSLPSGAWHVVEGRLLDAPGDDDSGVVRGGVVHSSLKDSIDLQRKRFDDWRPESNVVG